MVKLQKLSEYRKSAFAGKPPSVNWLKQRIKEGDIPGEVIGGMYFVHIHTTGNPIADMLIEY